MSPLKFQTYQYLLYILSLAISFFTPGHLFAANLSSDILVSSVSQAPSGVNSGTSGGDYAFMQASNTDKPGFSVLSSIDQIAYLASNGAASSGVTVQSIVFTGDPIELGIPGELGSVTIQAGNTIPDISTLRTYSRPVVFTQLIDDGMNTGAAIVPLMPIMEGNSFSFTVEAATGQPPDLEGATLHYFIAEEGWHSLADGRMLLVSSVELRDENYAGQTFALGASFTNATTIAQIQRPALILNDDGSVIEKSGYQGVLLTGGQGTFSTSTMRFMADAAYEAEATVRNFGARMGFMILGDANVHRGWPVAEQPGSPMGVTNIFGAGKFENYPHSAAASPLFNTTACADDMDVDGYCMYMAAPADIESRQSRFDLPRLPYVDEKFQALTLNLNQHGSTTKDDSLWFVDLEAYFKMPEWEAVIEEAIENPDNYNKYVTGECLDADNCPVNGALSQAMPKYDADRWWDDGVFITDYGHWYNVRNYDACIQDGISTACVDLTTTDLFGSPGIDWQTTTLTSSNWASWGDSFPLEEQLAQMTPEQAVFTELDISYASYTYVVDLLTPDTNAATRLAQYLNFEIPDEIVWVRCGYITHPRMQSRLNDYTNILNLDPWQILGSKIYAFASEYENENYTWSTLSRNGIYIPFPVGDDSWENSDACYPVFPIESTPNLTMISRVIKPVLGQMGEYVIPGRKLFANYPFTGNESNLRWLRSADKNHATATEIVSGQAGYIATPDDEGFYVSFCLDNSDDETACSEDWVYVKTLPYVAWAYVSPRFQPKIGQELTGYWRYKDPDGNQESGSQFYWIVDADGKRGTTPVIAPDSNSETYTPTGISPGGWVKFCVTPSSIYATGETFCSESQILDYDTDGDGYVNLSDLDDDGDGWIDGQDAFPLDANEQLDTDGDGIGDNADTDDDNDGLTDEEELTEGADGFITNPKKANTDGDDYLDGEDVNPLYAGEWLDQDGDGIHDKDDTDSDNDGTDDEQDAKPYEACLSDNIIVTNANDAGTGSLRQAISDICPSGTITFNATYTIHLNSPLKPYSGVVIDGGRNVTLSGDSDNDGAADVQIFVFDLARGLPPTQNLQLREITLSHAKAAAYQGSAVTLFGPRHLFMDDVLLTNNEGPALAAYMGYAYLSNSIVAHTTGSSAAIYNGEGFISAFSSTFINNEGGAISSSSTDDTGQLRNSLLLNGESGSAACNITLDNSDGNWIEEDSTCGTAGVGFVTLADAANDDYRPIPGSASIDSGIEEEGMMFDFAGNTRIQNLIPDIGALEYNPNGDFDGDSIVDSLDDFPIDPNNDLDGDTVSGHIDNCPAVANPAQTDTDSDSLGNACDAFPYDANNDADGDSVSGHIDNCPAIANTDQANTDSDSLGNVCDAFPYDANNDADGDGVSGHIDNCPTIANPDQIDTDNDALGNLCDAGTLAFSSSNINVAEEDGTAILTIYRANGSVGAISAICSTTNITAHAASDYTALYSRIYWAGGDATEKQCNVAITDDYGIESNQSFQVNLSRLTGGATLMGITRTIVTITDNDVDSDRDGISDSYENQYTFLNPNTSSDATKDPDRDGLTNLYEFDNDLDPTDGICPAWVCGGRGSWRHAIPFK